ncbi:hypothetical protein QR680_008959 [Steinernema hermaphroditum]|uniref:Uncharacterized protein n=1 Tax=Steinernema hermaphroditum TaxID=289476 RepID=A0AA39IKF4_9BILA|nr:hypothetical protein QR680_008959 [Steinernema hermaphroditum]
MVKMGATCRKLLRMAMKMPFCLRVDQWEVMLPMTGRQAEKAKPMLALRGTRKVEMAEMKPSVPKTRREPNLLSMMVSGKTASSEPTATAMNSALFSALE